MNQAYKGWRQTDPRFNLVEAWPARQFPEASFRYFRDAGCLVCALALMLRHYGIEEAEKFDPWILNERLKSCGAFTAAADLELSAVGRLYPLAYAGTVPYSQAALARIAEGDLPCLITVPGKNAAHHFTALLRTLPEDAVVYDPLCGERKLSSYERVCEIRVFRPSGAPGEPGATERSQALCRLDEEAVWNALIQPVTVLRGDMRQQVKARARPDLSCADYTGVVTCASQAVHILEQGEEWTLIEAYSSADEKSDVRIYADRFEGYVRTCLLREAEVDQTYGLVIDKLLQRMYVFRDGRLFSTLTVSTGLAAEDASSLETPAGEFLIVSWEGNFWADDYLCGYGMRINKSIFIHQVPGILRTDETDGREFLDYDTCERRLGKKDSHGCIRVQRHPTPEGVNAEWLFENLHRTPCTKVMIWDDAHDSQSAGTSVRGAEQH